MGKKPNRNKETQGLQNSLSRKQHLKKTGGDARLGKIRTGTEKKCP